MIRRLIILLLIVGCGDNEWICTHPLIFDDSNKLITEFPEPYCDQTSVGSCEYIYSSYLNCYKECPSDQFEVVTESSPDGTGENIQLQCEEINN